MESLCTTAVRGLSIDGVQHPLLGKASEPPPSRSLRSPLRPRFSTPSSAKPRSLPPHAHSARLCGRGSALGFSAPSSGEATWSLPPHAHSARLCGRGSALGLSAPSSGEATTRFAHCAGLPPHGLSPRSALAGYPRPARAQLRMGTATWVAALAFAAAVQRPLQWRSHDPLRALRRPPRSTLGQWAHPTRVCFRTHSERLLRL